MDLLVGVAKSQTQIRSEVVDVADFRKVDGSDRQPEGTACSWDDSLEKVSAIHQRIDREH